MKLPKILYISCLIFTTSFTKNASCEIPQHIVLGQIREQLQNPDKNLIKFLIEQGADIHTIFEGNCNLLPFAILCQSDISFLQDLIDRGIDVNKIDDNGGTALGVAVSGAILNPQSFNYYLEVAKLLLRHGANPNVPLKETNQTALWLSLGKEPNKSEPMTSLLLEAGADPNIQDSKFKYTALHCAVHQGAPLSIIEQFLQHGANPNIQDSKFKHTALHCAIQKKASLNIIEQLLQHGADPKIQCQHPFQANALHFAVFMAADPVVIQALLKTGIDPNLSTDNGWAALEFAIAAAKKNLSTKNILETAKLLIQYGADTKSSRSVYGPIANTAEQVLGINHPLTLLLRESNIKK